MNCSWFKSLAHMKFTSFTAVAVTLFILKTFASYLFVNNKIKKKFPNRASFIYNIATYILFWSSYFQFVTVLTSLSCTGLTA